MLFYRAQKPKPKSVLTSDYSMGRLATDSRGSLLAEIGLGIILEAIVSLFDGL